MLTRRAQGVTHYAAPPSQGKDSIALVEYLLSVGADKSLQNLDGETALSWAKKLLQSRGEATRPVLQAIIQILER